jgi:hypothetical protein
LFAVAAESRPLIVLSFETKAGGRWLFEGLTDWAHYSQKPCPVTQNARTQGRAARHASDRRQTKHHNQLILNTYPKGMHMDKFADYPTSLTAPARDAATVAPNDLLDLSDLPRAIYVGQGWLGFRADDWRTDSTVFECSGRQFLAYSGKGDGRQLGRVLQLPAFWRINNRSVGSATLVSLSLSYPTATALAPRMSVANKANLIVSSTCTK